MSFPVGPAAVLAAGPVALQLPVTRPGEWAAAVVFNATPFLLLVQLDTDQVTLAPWTADLVDLSAVGGGVKLQALQAPGGPDTTTAQSYVMANFLAPEDDTPGSHYPLRLAAQLIATTVGP